MVFKSKLFHLKVLSFLFRPILVGPIFEHSEHNKVKFKAQIVKEDENGQALMEFFLLLAMVFILSLAMLKVVNNQLSVVWKVMVETVAPAGTNIQFR